MRDDRYAGTQEGKACACENSPLSRVPSGPGRGCWEHPSHGGVDTAQAVRFLALVHRNMNTIYSNPTAIPPGNTDSINDHDGASKRAFDVCSAYQRALANADVSFPNRSNP